jgi:hypothetical protein
MLTLEELHRTFVRFRFRATGECAQIAPLPCPRIDFTGVQSVLAGLEFADHGDPLRASVIY